RPHAPSTNQPPSAQPAFASPSVPVTSPETARPAVHTTRPLPSPQPQHPATPPLPAQAPHPPDNPAKYPANDSARCYADHPESTPTPRISKQIPADRPAKPRAAPSRQQAPPQKSDCHPPA